jgi:peptidoglycan L-alanyl-D-glutamate endopeptidase CwlK
MLASGNTSQINRLHPSIRDAVIKLLSTLTAQGINVGIVASMRTIEQQNTEYRRGRDDNGNDIPGEVRTTWVQGGYSYHNYGLAIDLEVYTDIDKSWAKDWNVEGAAWQTVITTAESLGFTSGYRWEGEQKDSPHFQIEQGKTTTELKALYDAGTMKDGFVALPE